MLVEQELESCLKGQNVNFPSIFFIPYGVTDMIMRVIEGFSYFSCCLNTNVIFPAKDRTENNYILSNLVEVIRYHEFNAYTMLCSVCGDIDEDSCLKTYQDLVTDLSLNEHFPEHFIEGASILRSNSRFG